MLKNSLRQPASSASPTPDPEACRSETICRGDNSLSTMTAHLCLATKTVSSGIIQTQVAQTRSAPYSGIHAENTA
jgi:hypothetical protein